MRPSRFFGPWLIVLATSTNAAPVDREPESTACDQTMAVLAEDREVNETYRRFVAAATELGRGRRQDRTDQDLITAVRREYARLFSRALDYPELAASVLRTGQIYEESLLKAVTLHVQSRTRAAVARANEVTPFEKRVSEVHDAYLKALRDPPPLSADSRAHAATLVRKIDRAYESLHGHRPTNLSANDEGLRGAVKEYLRSSGAPTYAKGLVRGRPSGVRDVRDW